MDYATLVLRGASLLDRLRPPRLKLVAAESCTGGLLTAILTEVPGASDVVERGFVTYSNDAKSDLVDVPAAMIAEHGAVSEAVARAMAEGALTNSRAEIAVSITGVAGPDGGSEEKPIGLVYIAAARYGHATQHRRCAFGPLSRSDIRHASIAIAFELIETMVDEKGIEPPK
jgi:nicotinamide-nucleotide amidase